MGCAAVIYDTSRLQYLKDVFGPESLNSGGLALLPVLAGKGQEGYRRPFGEALNHSFQTIKPQLNFIKWEDTMSIINQHGLTETYQDAILTYRDTAILGQSFLHQFAEALQVRYVLVVNLEEFHTSSVTKYSIWTGLTTITTTKVSSFAQVWDCSTADVVWEGRGEAVSHPGEFTYDKPYEEFCQSAADGLVRKLP